MITNEANPGAVADTSDPELEALKKNWLPVDFIGLAAGLVPFVLSYSETSTHSVTTRGSGVDVTQTIQQHVDYIALGGGAVAIACAVIGLLLIARTRTRALRFAVFAGVLALGGFQIIRGTLTEGGTSVSGTLSR
jgi:hypothetical protein